MAAQFPFAMILSLASSLAAENEVPAAYRPLREREHVQIIRSSREVYSVGVSGTADMDNTTTRRYETFQIAFQNNISLTLANTGKVIVKHPRVITNGKRRWWCLEEILKEVLEGAEDDQERALLIWEFLRGNRHHDDPIFQGDELHDPVKMLNIYGAGLCDDSGYVGCSLLYHAGLNEKKYGKNPSERTLHGHMMCEAFLDGGYQFLDIDENTFYLDLENERPASGDAVARDHYLAKREHAYGPIFRGWRIGEGAASLFGRDDGSTFRAVRGHRMELRLRPGERIVYRWDNCGKFASDDRSGKRNRRFWGNSLWIYEPVLTEERIRLDTREASRGHFIYEMKTPYALCGGRVKAQFLGDGKNPLAISISLDGKSWSEVWTSSGRGDVRCNVTIDGALQYKKGPARYSYLVKVASPREALQSLAIETDLMTSPHSLPRLGLEANRVEYTDETSIPHQVTVTHRWRESDSLKPPHPPSSPISPRNGETIRSTTVPFRWEAGAGAVRHHIRVSRRRDLRLPYRPCLDVVVESTEHHPPFPGLFNPGETYFWRVRPCNRHGLWGDWSPTWTFRWQGPRIPVNLKRNIRGGEITISWEPNRRGPEPHTFEVYGSDERGFTPSKDTYPVEGLGRQPSNLLCTTTSTEILVVSPASTEPAGNRSFYRVVAVDEMGVASGPSDLLELPHPFIYSKPVETAAAGKPYRYEAKTLRCLGDLQYRYTGPNRAFWEREEYEFELVQGPAWMVVEKNTGVLSGTPGPGDTGAHQVTIRCHRRYPAEQMGNDRAGYFQKDRPRFQATAEQTFRIQVR